MKLDQLVEVKYYKQQEQTVDVTIGFDDHCSVYRVPYITLVDLARINNVEQLVDAIIGNGTLIDWDNPCDKGDVFLTLDERDLEEFRLSIREL